MAKIEPTDYHDGTVSQAGDEAVEAKGCTLWFTGLSGRARHGGGCVEQVLVNNGHAAYVLDGDNISSASTRAKI